MLAIIDNVYACLLTSFCNEFNTPGSTGLFVFNFKQKNKNK